MKSILNKVEIIRKSQTSKLIDKRLKEFKQLGRKGNDEWFCELCFCILTANSKAATALSIQDELGVKGFLCLPEDSVCDCIKRNKHRFHNNKARYIIHARKYRKIKDILKKQKDPRAWLVENIKGLGWKESSHFLRNVGYTDYAIIDRHVLNILKENNLIKKKPGSLQKSKYLEIESILLRICKKLNMTQAELDMYLWYMKTGQVLK